MFLLHSTVNFRGMGRSGPGCYVAMLTHLGLEPREKAGSRRAGQILSYSLRQSVRCGPHRDDLAGRVFGYATSAISERSLERHFYTLS